MSKANETKILKAIDEGQGAYLTIPSLSVLTGLNRCVVSAVLNTLLKRREVESVQVFAGPSSPRSGQAPSNAFRIRIPDWEEAA